MLLSDFTTRAAASLRRDAPLTWDHSDDDNNERARLIPDGVVPKAAAVLIAVTDGNVPTVLLTQRKATLSKHAGQIAFPGGRIDAGETALDAALREAEEEVGLDRRFVSPLGYLDGYLTVTGFFIVPVVATISAGYTLTAQADEVDDMFDVPLAFLMGPENRRIEMREWNGLQRRYFAYPYQQRHIWGATAGIIKNLSVKLGHG